MNLPKDYIKHLGYESELDIIENLYLKSLIKAYSIILEIDDISAFSENNIRNEFQYVFQFNCEKISDLINNNLISLSIENQIVNNNKEQKRTDIEFNIPKLKYVIECKKLKGVSKSQYIDSGIKRFIENIYISNNEKYAGMCSFLVSEDVGQIIIGTKERIMKYNFDSFKNSKIYGFMNSFSSIHKRENGEKILIHHLFFELNHSI